MKRYLVVCEYGGIAETDDLHEAFEIMYNDPDGDEIIDQTTDETVATKKYEF